MRLLKICLLASSLLAGVAHAGADKPILRPAPDWVTSVPMPDSVEKSDETPVRLLLSDQQAKLDRAQQTLYSNVAIRIQTPQGLSAGNLSFPWDPETDELSVHKLVIHRGGETIDVLGSGQSFTVIRREPNLENAMLDGMLTANIQPEGLQVGDVLEFAISISRSDPVLNGHVEQVGAVWNGIPISRAHLKVQWPNHVPIAMRQTGALPAVKIAKVGDISSITLSLDNVEPLIPPKYAPARYWTGRMIELSDFRSWADIGALMAPLYGKAAVVPASGALRTELEKIKAASADPVKRAEAALALVQDRIRYVALLMGTGGYVPASAEETWSRRFGDCKAKTALLLALLKELDVAAEPVAVNVNGGDGFDKRLPMLGLFNHVLVRATIAGQSYWLDGTRTGDTSLARLRVPALDWGLPLVAGAQLVRMEAEMLAQPDEELNIEIDAREGLSLPTPFKAETVLRGDGAIGLKLSLAGMTADARNEGLRRYWKGKFDFVEISSTDAVFDPATGEQRMTMQGLARMDWNDGFYEADDIGLGYKADFTRPAGPDRDAPYAVQHPSYSRTTETIRLPPGFPEGKDLPNAAVNETIAGIEYRRTAQLSDNVFRIEASSRSIAPEFPAKEAPAAEKGLRALAERRVFLKRPVALRMTKAEMDAAIATKPETSERQLARGVMLLDMGRFDDAIADFEAVLAKDPRDATALINRGVARAWLNQIDAASKDIDAGAAIDPKHAVIPRARGLIAERRGDPKGAIAAFGQALALDSSDRFSLGHRAELYRATGDAAAALADADQALKLQPQWAEMHLLRANVFREQGKRDEALAEAAALADTHRGDIFPQVAAARIYAAFDRRDQAMAVFDAALKTEKSPLIFMNRAQIRDRADFAGREADYDAALEMDPTLSDALAGKAQLSLDRGEPQRAVALLSDALAKAPTDNIELLSTRGIAYAKAGDLAKAEDDFAKVRAQALTAPLLNNLCWQKAVHDVALETALKECDAALAITPDSPAVLDSRAFVLLRLGRLDEAIAGYTRALEKRPDLSASLFGRAVAWAGKGDGDKANADLVAARRVDPKVQETFANYGIKF